MTLAYRSAIALLMVGLSFGPAAALDVIKQSTFTRISDVELKGDAERHFKSFAKHSLAFGSFYVSSDGSQFGSSFYMFSQSAADTLAKTQCEARSAGRCTVLARHVPENAVGELAVPISVQRGFRGLRSSTRSGRFAAMAINGVGGTAYAINDKKHPLRSEEDARSRAMELCNTSTNSTKKKLPSHLSSAYARAGLFDCKVVFVFRKS